MQPKVWDVRLVRNCRISASRQWVPEEVAVGAAGPAAEVGEAEEGQDMAVDYMSEEPALALAVVD